MFLLGICWHGYAAEGTGWENEKFLQCSLNFKKKEKDSPLKKREGKFPAFPLFRLRNIKYFRVISPLFLPLPTLLQHPPPALSSSAFRTAILEWSFAYQCLIVPCDFRGRSLDLGWEVFKRGYPLPYSIYGIFCGRSGWWNKVMLFVVP